MVKIKMNVPKKVKLPPTTVDILGITERQAGQLLSLLGEMPSEVDDDLGDLYDALAGEVSSVGSYVFHIDAIEYNE